MAELLIGSGLRISEALALRVGDLELEKKGGVIVVYRSRKRGETIGSTKSDRFRAVEIGPGLCGVLRVNDVRFAATVRAFVRLTRPDQVLITTYDDAVAASLADDLAPANGWPEAVTRLRCERGADDASTVINEAHIIDSQDTQRELALLGLIENSTAVA